MYKTDVIRPATSSDADEIKSFLQKRIQIHQHLDWRKPTHWLGSNPYLIQFSKDNSIEAILNCAPEPNDVYWVRLFACNNNSKEIIFWNSLFTVALSMIAEQSKNPTIAALSYQKWMSHLLETEGWHEYQRVIQLKWNSRKTDFFESFSFNPKIRLMRLEDLDQVSAIDNLCFEPIWQQSREAIGQAYDQSGYATIYENDQNICGFLISTNEKRKAHLARIAVLPDFQRQHIAEKMILDMLNFFTSNKITAISVNTQENNFKSINLYNKLNFLKTNESFPIYVHH